jgi:hypothetical protein
MKKYSSNSNDLVRSVQASLNGQAFEVAERLFKIKFKNNNGKNRFARCPIHQESHGHSFSMREDGVWYCFGKCSRGGTMTDLVRLLLNEQQPLKFLANYLHIYK